MINQKNKNQERLKRHQRVRNKVFGTSERPRLCVYRSLSGIYAQIIDDSKGMTLASSSALNKDLKDSIKDLNKTAQAEAVGQDIAKKTLKLKISKVVFDRGGYIYSGRVKALADAARKAGLEF
ncbi:MAG: 50S ribosomal protein L18 [Clostridia bacterium]|jgi:large subunit ribosomal protein L18|nr:50S ribosomal protein L18 [Clostridia bacterium]MDD3231854.1 50S ribosomal protein L18 [Clostridia bacterium]MDD4408457.1 50S ribosomal protein L18 [Clostridia bacterium]